MKWLQYRIIHNFLPTRHFLFKIGYVDSPLCSFCKNKPETIDHMMWNCDIITKIWKDLEMWFYQVQLTLKLTKQKVILGIKGKNNNPINAIILLVKQIIYRCSLNGYRPNIYYIKREIVRYYDITKFIYLSRGVEQTFIQFWSTLHLLFNNIDL